MRDPVSLIRAAVRRGLDAHTDAGLPVAIGLSGGRDSVALLDALVHAVNVRHHGLLAIHVHHGLSPNADAWAAFCNQLCTDLGVPLVVRRVVVPRTPRSSLESEARTLRNAALGATALESGTRYVVLGHHRDDQAETLLLQLLRGAGPHGLAGMAPAREDAGGVTWLRPLLDVSRAAIDAYVAQRDLRWIDDESNQNTVHLRNAVRHTVLPALARVHGESGKTLARAARHQAEAARLADDLAALDACTLADGVTLDRAGVAALPPHRARNLLRWFLRQQSLPAPSSARLAAMLDQLRGARADASVRLVHAGKEIGIHRGRIVLHPQSMPVFDVRWHGEPELALPHGRLVFAQAIGAGVDAEKLALAAVRVRARAGGERFQVAPDRPRRALKAVLREAGIPEWERSGLPLVFCGDTLAAVAGIGVDAAFCAAPGRPGVTLTWHPRSD